MHRLVVNPGTPQTWSIQLRPGSNFIGRGFANDFKIEDPSISSSHCEIFVEQNFLRIKDLGSTNGTFVDQAQVQETVVKAGQRLRLGSVEMIVEIAAADRGVINIMEFARIEAPAPAPGEIPTAIVARSAPVVVAPPPASPPVPRVPMPAPAPHTLNRATPAAAATVAEVSSAVAPATVESDGPVFCKNHYQNAARFYCAKCKRYLCDLCVNMRGQAGGGSSSCKICAQPVALVSIQSHVPKEVNFFGSISSAFKYPVIGDGLLLLFLGSFFFVALDAANYVALKAGKYGTLGSRGMMMRAVVITFVLGTGYLFSYLKKIVYATASGEHRMPDWPELSEWQADILTPMFQFLIVTLLSFGPAIGVRIWFDGEHMWLVWLLAFFGCFYFPMGLLGVAMFDSLAALNPLFVIASILKVLGEYSIAALIFTVIVGFRLLVETVLSSVLKIPLVPVLIADLLAIYLLIVETRILGLLYLARKDTLGWFKKRNLRGAQ